MLTRTSLILCGIYYWVWIFVLPKYRGYEIRQELLVLDNGATTHKLHNIPLAELADWDAKHDVTGKYLDGEVAHGSGNDTHKNQGVLHKSVET